MNLKLIDLSKNKTKGINTYEGTFMVDNELVPLKVSEADRPQVYAAISQVLETPITDIDKTGAILYNLMSPEGRVRAQISNSAYLSENMSIINGVIKFGEFILEETLSNHILSLLDEKNVPKDEKLWKSYVAFLDNLHQNVNEDIRKQLFRWMEYENKAGNGFAITEDGCIVGYKGCNGSVLEPISAFAGTAIVDGIEIKGKIPNKVGSVIKMPRSEVQYDPSVGCAQGLHVGTRNYAINWAPILLLVKVNPRDVVSVPYENDSQKMRVCEYTVLKVTDASEEHERFHPSSYTDDTEVDNEDLVLYVDDVLELMDEEIYVEYDNGAKNFSGTVIDVYEGYNPGVVIKNYDTEEYKHIKLNRIYDWSPIEDIEDNEDLVLYVDDALELIDEEIYVEYDNGAKNFSGYVIEVHEGYNPGIVIKNYDTEEYKHIKLNRIYDWELIEDLEDFESTEIEDEEPAEEEAEDNYTPESVEPFVNCEVKVTYDEDEVEVGIITSVYEHMREPSIIITLGDEGLKHLIELNRIKEIELIESEDEIKDKEADDFFTQLKKFMDEFEK